MLGCYLILLVKMQKAPLFASLPYLASLPYDDNIYDAVASTQVEALHNVVTVEEYLLAQYARIDVYVQNVVLQA